MSNNQNICWFCRMSERNMRFSKQLNFHFHYTCLKNILLRDPTHREACLVAREFNFRRLIKL